MAAAVYGDFVALRDLDLEVSTLKKLAKFATLLILLALPALGMQRYSGMCNLPTGTASGVTVPLVAASCTVTIFDSGTANLSSIFSDDISTPQANPFTASSNGRFFFYAADGAYDVRLSGGTPTIPTVTIGAVSLGSNGFSAPVVTTTGTQTLTNKTLTTPIIGSFTNATHTHANAAGGGQITDAALSAAVTVPKGGTGDVTLTAHGVLIGNGTGAVAVTGAGTAGQVLTSNGAAADPTFQATGAIIDPGGNGVVVRTALNTTIARTITGTANRVTLSNGDGVAGNPTLDIGTDVVTLTGSQVLTNKTLTAPIISTISNTGVLTLPTSTDTLVGRATTDTLTNKTLTTPTIADFTNATHNHSNAAGGGAVSTAALTGTVGLAAGGTNANLGATGGAGRFLKQTSAGAAITVAVANAGDLTEIIALTDLTDVASKRGNSTQVQMTTGVAVASNLASFDSNGNIIDSGLSTLGTASAAFPMFCSGTATSSTTLFVTVWNSGACTDNSEGVNNQILAPSVRTLRNLRVKAGTTGSAAGSGAFTLRINGSNTTVTCTVGNSGTTCSDVTHTAAVAAGDTVTLQFTTQGTETLADVLASFEW